MLYIMLFGVSRWGHSIFGFLNEDSMQAAIDDLSRGKCSIPFLVSAEMLQHAPKAVANFGVNYGEPMLPLVNF